MAAKSLWDGVRLLRVGSLGGDLGCRACPLKGGFCALRAQGLFFYVIWAASGGEAKLSLQGFKRKQSRACPLRDGFCALWAQGLFFYVIWAASGGGRWGPVRGCRPSEAPSALPPDDPAGLVVPLRSHGLAPEGFPYSTIPRGLRGFCSGSFLAVLGDLPARRAMPSCAFALNGRSRASGWLQEVSGMESGCWEKACCGEGLGLWNWF